MVDVPEQQHEPRERARLYGRAHRIDDGISCVLLVVQGDNTWSIHGHGEDLPARGVRVPNDVMLLLAQQIVKYS